MSDNFKFFEYDAQEFKKQLEKAHTEIIGTSLSKGDPMNDFIDYATYILTVACARINEAARQNLLRYSTGKNLEALGEFAGEYREGVKPALTTIRYTFSKSFDSVVAIKKGHKTAVEGVYFLASENTNLLPGKMFVDVKCKCSIDGEIGNGYEAGEIKTIVDPMPYLVSVSNLTATEGGAEIETDESLREKIRENPSSKSVAGPETAYQYHTKKSHQDIIDVNVRTIKGTGIVYITPLMKDGEIPGEEILQKVQSDLMNKEIKPLTDYVEVTAPEAVGYGIDLDYYIYEADKYTAEGIVEKINEVVGNYVAWQCSKLGRDINPDRLRALIISAGAKRCVIREPQYSVLERTQVAKIEQVTVNYGGLENE